MAAFKDRKNGSWYVQFRYTDWRGERQQKLKRGFTTKKEAQAWEREFLMQKQADVNMSFESFVALYEKDVKAVSGLVSAAQPVWTGSPSELADVVSVGMAANALSKYLNVKSGRLLDEYHVRYENRVRHEGRRITLTYMVIEAVVE